MKVLAIGSDKNVLVPGTDAHSRMQLQAAVAEHYVVLVPKVGESKLAAALRIWRQAQQEQYDIVTAQDPFFIGLLAWAVARRIGARLLVQVHTDLSAYRGVRHILAQIVLRHADTVRVVSEKIKKQVEAIDVHAPTHVLPIFVDIEAFKNLERRAHTQKTILWVGRFEEEKDPLSALRVLREVQASVDAKLVLLGAGSLEKELRAEAQGLSVEFAGWQDPKKYLPLADVVLSTSRHESWGASMVEALAAGVPVVAPDIGIAQEAGATVVSRDTLADAIVTILRSGEQGVLRLELLPKEAYLQRYKQLLESARL